MIMSAKRDINLLKCAIGVRLFLFFEEETH